MTTADTVQSMQLMASELMATQQKMANAFAAVAQMAVEERNEPYLSTKELVQALGAGLFDEQRILADVKAGLFKQGRDFINLSNGARPTYGFKASCIRKVYETPPEKRKTYSN